MFTKISLYILALSILFSGCSPNPNRTNANSGYTLKLYTNSVGVTRVRFLELEKFGVNPEHFQTDNIALTWRRIPQPFWINGVGRNASLDFYATKSDSSYSRQNVYMLRIGVESQDTPLVTVNHQVENSPAFSDITPSSSQPGTYIDHLTVEENIIYLPLVRDGDNWLWMNLHATQMATISVAANHLVEGLPSVMQIAVWSQTEAEADPDHHLRIIINGVQLPDQYWDGAGWIVLEVDVPPDVLLQGENKITIEAPGDMGLAADITYLDKINIHSLRYPVAQNDRLTFNHPVDKMAFSGFSGRVAIFDISDPSRVHRVAEQTQPGSYNYEPGKGYAIVGPEGYLSIEAIQPVQEDDASELNQIMGADYIAIGPVDLIESVKPLLEYRRKQGLKVIDISLITIYDEFNFGFPEPEAIQRFVRYAVDNWEPAPRYILLLGDATYDPKGYQHPVEDNRLPTFEVYSSFGGRTSSDVQFVQVNDDPWPDLAIGRIPAHTKVQVKILVNKILAYETNLSQKKLGNNILAIADGQEPEFQADAQRFLDLFPTNYPKKLYKPEAGVTNGGLEIINSWDDPQFIVAYFGHGSINMWGKDRLFTAQEIEQLPAVNQAPIVINLTCLTGFFTHPKVESLAESLLWKEGSGAVGVLAPSSLTLPNDQSILSNALVKELLANPMSTLGDIHLRARRQVPADAAGSLDVMQTFMLFGDPALRLIP